MKNYIPEDFYTKQKTTVYTSRKRCLECEGTVIEFDPRITDLTISNIAGGVITVDEHKKSLRDAELSAGQYKKNREAEYPKIGDQLDAIWKQIAKDRLDEKELIQEVDDLLGRILAVKNKYPKPDEQ